MPEPTDVAIIGAGPAGLAAARTATDNQLNVTLIDEQSGVGGQIYRAIESAPPSRIAVLGDDYEEGRSLLDVLNAKTLQHVNEATVWDIGADNTIYYSRDGAASTVSARHIIIATGAIERPMPFPGWHLPGVMTAGGAQIMLKSSGILPATPVVLAGSGPLLYLLAAQYSRAGHPVSAIVETTPKGNYRAALKYAAGIVRGHSYLRKGLALLNEIKKSGMPHFKGARNLIAEGGEHVEALSFDSNGKRETLPLNTLLIHLGVVPNVQLTRMLGIDHQWHPLQRCWHPVTGPFGDTSRTGVILAGDSRGIGGAHVAIKQGHLAALHVVRQLNGTGSEKLKGERNSAHKQIHREQAGRPFLDALYAPSQAFLVPADDTLVCRCEEVTAGSIREYVSVGCLGPNQTKAFGRCGMGPCQGRFCGLTVSEIIAEKRRISVAEVGYYRIRPPIKPVTLGEMAKLT